VKRSVQFTGQSGVFGSAMSGVKRGCGFGKKRQYDTLKKKNKKLS
jgi:hypothetical protein